MSTSGLRKHYDNRYSAHSQQRNGAKSVACEVYRLFGLCPVESIYDVSFIFPLGLSRHAYYRDRSTVTHPSRYLPTY